MYSEIFAKIKGSRPLVHCITNYVTVNDMANILLACGGSPIMADAPEEVVDMVGLCSGLLINIGTANARTAEAMLLAGKAANAKGIPVVLDPVGVGATPFRRELVARLLGEIGFAAVKGNTSEIKTLAGMSVGSRGVDAMPNDEISAEICAGLARKLNTIVVATGATDIISNGQKHFAIANGRPEMENITGTGCQLGAMLTAALVASHDDMVGGAAAAVLAMGIAGEIGWQNMADCDGNSTYRNRVIDAIWHMGNGGEDIIDKYAKIEAL